MMDQVRHQVGGFTTCEGTTIVVERTKHHRDRDAFEGFVKTLGNLLTHVEQHEIDKEGGLELELDAIGRGFPEGGEIPHALGDQERIFNAPAPAVHLADGARAERGRIQHLGEVAIPLPAP
jgi:hypothetical protein